MKIKKLFSISIVTIAFLVIFSCKGKNGMSGEDGEDGKAAIAYSWMGNIWDIWSTDQTIPQIFYNGTYYYYATPGTYSYGYSGDGGSWTGYYTIWINEGEPGKPGKHGGWFWQDGADGKDGADGEDMCFELYMFSYIGPSFYEWYCSFKGIDLPRIAKDTNDHNYTRYMNDINKELENYPNNESIHTKEELEQIKLSNLNESEIIQRLDNHPSTVIELGKKVSIILYINT